MLLTPILLAVITADATPEQFTATFQGLSVDLVAIRDVEGNTWRPGDRKQTDKELDELMTNWSPAPQWASSGKQSSFQRQFLIRASGPEIDACSFRFDVNGTSQMATSSSSVQSAGSRFFELSCVFRKPIETTTIEVHLASGGWDDVQEVPFGRDYGSSGNFQDGGRRAEYTIRASSGESGGSSRIAAAALTLSDHESFQDEYRFVAVDENANVIAEPTTSSNSSRLILYVIEVPETTRPDPVKFLLQTRPRVPVEIKNIPLNQPSK